MATESQGNGRATLGFGKFSLSANDPVLLLSVLILALGALLVFHVRLLSGEHQGIAEELRNQTYIMSKPQSERPNLVMPASLRNRMIPPGRE